MPWNLLILPLLGGYIFASAFRLTSYHAKRAEGHRLIFFAAISGFVLLLIALSIKYYLFKEHNDWYVDAAKDWDAFSVVPYSAVTTLAFFLSIPAALVLNLCLRRQDAIDIAINSKSHPLELLLQKCIDGKESVEISVSGGRTYVGNVTTTINPGHEVEFIGIIPHITGYRDSETKVFKFTSKYTDIYAGIKADLERQYVEAKANRNLQWWGRRKILQKISKDKKLKDFEHIIPVAEIQSIHIFDSKIFKEHFAGQAPIDKAASNKPDDPAKRKAVYDRMTEEEVPIAK